MNPYLSEYLSQNDYAAVSRGCISWISDWFACNGADCKAVIGISGGKDSTAVAALCVRALGPDRVLGVMMPDGVQPDIDVSRRVMDHLGIESVEINIHDSLAAVKKSLIEGMGLRDFSPRMLINLPPRIRMTTLYAVSQSVNGRVSNNSNRSEKYVGYSTIFGDAAGDFSPLANLTVSEIRRMMRCLDLPEEFTEKAPADGLSGRTDEDAFGFTYEELDTYILTGFCADAETKARIDARHKANLFKCRPMPEYEFQEDRHAASK